MKQPAKHFKDIAAVKAHRARGRLFSDDVLEQAFAWLYHQRRHWPADADVWHVRHH